MKNAYIIVLFKLLSEATLKIGVAFFMTKSRLKIHTRTHASHVSENSHAYAYAQAHTAAYAQAGTRIYTDAYTQNARVYTYVDEQNFSN